MTAETDELARAVQHARNELAKAVARRAGGPGGGHEWASCRAEMECLRSALAEKLNAFAGLHAEPRSHD